MFSIESYFRNEETKNIKIVLNYPYEIIIRESFVDFIHKSANEKSEGAM